MDGGYSAICYEVSAWRGASTAIVMRDTPVNSPASDKQLAL